MQSGHVSHQAALQADLLIEQADLTHTEQDLAPDPELEPGEVRLHWGPGVVERRIAEAWVRRSAADRRAAPRHGDFSPSERSTGIGIFWQP